MCRHRSGHEFFLVVEADSSQALQDFLFPGLPIGIADTRPVTDALETARQRGDEAQQQPARVAERLSPGK